MSWSKSVIRGLFFGATVTADDVADFCAGVDVFTQGGDIPAFDFISQFGLDREQLLGVTEITGSTDRQRAYRISNDASLVNAQTPVLPKEFSINCILRMPDYTTGLVWDLFKIYDGLAEYSVQINGRRQTVVFIVADSSGKVLINSELKHAEALFNTEWHQLSLQVYGDRGDKSVGLFIDGDKVSMSELGLPLSLLDDFQDIRSGERRTSMATSGRGTHINSVPVDIQFFNIHCDARWPEYNDASALYMDAYSSNNDEILQIMDQPDDSSSELYISPDNESSFQFSVQEQRGDAADDEEPCYPCMGRDNNIQGLPGAPDQVLPGETEDSFNPEGDVDSLSGEPGEPVDDFKTSPGEQPAEDAQGVRGPRP